MAKLPRLLVPWIVALAGIVSTLATARHLRAAEAAALRAEITRHTQAIAGVITRSLQSYEEVLHSLRKLFNYSEGVTRDEFAGMAGDFHRRYRGIQALEWLPRVPGPERADFEARVRAEGFPDFEIRARATGNMFRRAPDLPEHFPITYIHPFEPNRTAFGFDIATGILWPQLQEAARTDQFHASGLVALITDGRSDQDWGYILHLPVRGRADAEATDPQPLQGFLVGVLRPRDIVEEALAVLGPQELDLLVVDPTALPDQRILHHRPGRRPDGPTTAAAPPDETGFRTDPYLQTATVAIADRSWELLLRPPPAWLAAYRSGVGFVLTAGLVGSILLGLYLHGLLRRSALVEDEVQERTAELQQARALLEEDIAQRREVEKRLQESESRLQAILDQNPNAIFVKDLAGRYLLCNGTFARLCGRTPADLVGRTDQELLPPAEAVAAAARDQEVLAAGAPREFEEVLPAHGGAPQTLIVSRFPLHDADGRAYALAGIATDITSRKAAEQERLHLERQLQEAHKLESLGVLAGGIAHDFNNLLTAILGNATLARQAAASHAARDHLAQIEQAARRAADLCQQMLAYAGKGRLTTTPVDLSAIVRGTASLLEVSISKKIRLDLRLAAGLPAVEADATQLRQIVMNLIINAADAIGDRAGQIVVTTAAGPVTAAELARGIAQPDLPGGIYARLEVADDGSGIAPATLARIFEPFFSTKSSGRGLGLSAVLGIVQAHRGALFVDSAEGRGTTFRLFFPATAAAPVDSQPPFLAPTSAPLSGRILVVDDEESVRDLTRVALELHGASVVAVGSGDEAVALVRAEGAAFDLVLLDLTMPGLSGEETVELLRTQPGRPPIVLMSGYSESDATQRIGHLGVAGFLQKPFELESLLQTIRLHLR